MYVEQRRNQKKNPRPDRSISSRSRRFDAAARGGLVCSYVRVCYKYIYEFSLTACRIYLIHHTHIKNIQKIQGGNYIIGERFSAQAQCVTQQR